MNARALGLVVAATVAAWPRRRPRTRRRRSPDRWAAASSRPRAPASRRSARWPRTTGVIAADARIRSRGASCCSVKSGAYVLLATTTPFRGRAGVDRKVDAIKVANGTSRKLRLSLVRRGGHIARKRKRTARAAAGPSFVSVTYPAVWVQHFAVSGPDEIRSCARASPTCSSPTSASRDQAALRRRARRARAPRRDHRRAEALPEPLRRPRHAHPLRAPDRPQPRRDRHADHQRRDRDAHGDGHQHHDRRAAVGHPHRCVGRGDLRPREVGRRRRRQDGLRSARALRRHGVRLDPGARGRGLGDLRLEGRDQPRPRSPRPRSQRAAPRASTPSSGPRAAPST